MLCARTEVAADKLAKVIANTVGFAIIITVTQCFVEPLCQIGNPNVTPALNSLTGRVFVSA